MKEDSPENRGPLSDLTPITEKSEEIMEKEEAIENSLESSLGSNIETSNFESVFQGMNLALQSEMEESEIEETASVFLNLISQPSTDLIEEIEETAENGDELAEFVRSCAIDYGRELQVLSNIHYRGPESWMEINTTKSIRASEPMFQHEFIRADSGRSNITSSVPGIVNLTKHMINQLLDAKSELGADTYNYLNRDQVNELLELAEELDEEISEYESSTSTDAAEIELEEKEE